KRQKKTPEQRRVEEDQKNARFDYLYTRHELEDIARTAREIARHPEVREVYAVNNNHNFGKAPTNALMLESMLTGEDLPPPRSRSGHAPEPRRGAPPRGGAGPPGGGAPGAPPGRAEHREAREGRPFGGGGPPRRYVGGLESVRSMIRRASRSSFTVSP